MDSIKTVLMNYAVCALLGSVFEFITPEKNKELIRIISSIVLIAVIIIPIASFDLFGTMEEIELEVEESEVYEDSILKTSKLIENELYKKIENILINKGIDEYEINISTKTDNETREIVLTGISVLLGKEYENEIQRLKEELNDEFYEVLKIGVKEDE